VILERKKPWDPLWRSHSRLPWTDDELEYLCDHVGTMRWDEIGSYLHRTGGSVKQMAHFHGWRVFDNFYTCRTLGKELGMSNVSMMRYHRRGWLKGKRAHFRLGYLNTPIMFFEPDIIKFLRSGKGILPKRLPNTYFNKILQEFRAKGVENARI
jgi:hypothetical protein